MYLPKHFEQHDPQALAALMREHPLATLVTVQGGEPTADHIPFEYDAPSPIALIADGTTLAVRDSKLATQDIYPLSQTPLRYLLSDRIDLMKDTTVVGVTADDIFVSVTIEEKQPLVGTSRLMLMVGAKDNQLKQWTVTDPQGYDTTVAIYNLDESIIGFARASCRPAAR